jgi:hypothetical protein
MTQKGGAGDVVPDICDQSATDDVRIEGLMRGISLVFGETINGNLLNYPPYF